MKAIGRLAVVLVLAASFAVASPVAAEPTHGWDVHCGQSNTEGGAWWGLKGYNVACSVARKVANQYVFHGVQDPRGWRCSRVQIGDEIYRTNCIRRKDGEHQHIRFKYGF